MWRVVVDGSGAGSFDAEVCRRGRDGDAEVAKGCDGWVVLHV